MAVASATNGEFEDHIRTPEVPRLRNPKPLSRDTGVVVTVKDKRIVMPAETLITMWAMDHERSVGRQSPVNRRIVQSVRHETTISQTPRTTRGDSSTRNTCLAEIKQGKVRRDESSEDGVTRHNCFEKNSSAITTEYPVFLAL